MPAFHLNLPSSSGLLARRASQNILNNFGSTLPSELTIQHQAYSQEVALSAYKFGTAADPLGPVVPDPPPRTMGEPASPPDDRGNFKKSLQIDMKGLVGDAVGNVGPRLVLFDSVDGHVF